jgi:hypothetical protein
MLRIDHDGPVVLRQANESYRLIDDCGNRRNADPAKVQFEVGRIGGFRLTSLMAAASALSSSTRNCLSKMRLSLGLFERFSSSLRALSFVTISGNVDGVLVITIIKGGTAIMIAKSAEALDTLHTSPPSCHADPPSH